MNNINSRIKKLMIRCLYAVGCMSCSIEHNSNDCQIASKKINELRETQEGSRYLDEIKY